MLQFPHRLDNRGDKGRKVGALAQDTDGLSMVRVRAEMSRHERQEQILADMRAGAAVRIGERVVAGSA